MYFIRLTYTVPLHLIDAVLPDHRAWLAQGYQDGIFLVSGRQVPRVGGAILAVGVPRGELHAVLARDPFCMRGYADYEVIEFEPSGPDRIRR